MEIIPAQAHRRSTTIMLGHAVAKEQKSSKRKENKNTHRANQTQSLGEARVTTKGKHIEPRTSHGVYQKRTITRSETQLQHEKKMATQPQVQSS